MFSTASMSIKNNMNNKSIEGPARVTIDKTNGQYVLSVNDQPFYINGAGLEFGSIEALAKHKGNSFRTWRTDNGQNTALEILDEAHKHGLMVTMGIEVARERHGFDYNDQKAVTAQLERIKKEVIALKDHPALLIWAIGNELNLRYTNPKVWDAVNDISQMIHQVDPNHPTTTTLAGISRREVQEIKERAPDLDILSFQVYGKLEQLPKQVRNYGWDGPYMVTEWGATGHWEVPRTSWGVPIEENSSVKAKNYLKRYQNSIQKDTAQCIGSYVFLWGQKQERTPTWYGVFTEDGSATESVDVMEYLWTGNWPQNRSPIIESFHLNNKDAYSNIKLAANHLYQAEVKSSDPDGDKLTYSFEILHESTDLKDGGDLENRPETVHWNRKELKEGMIEFSVPDVKGAYRIFVYVHDGNEHVATANIPFFVNNNVKQ
jgi:hypothetical protein